MVETLSADRVRKLPTKIALGVQFGCNYGLVDHSKEHLWFYVDGADSAGGNHSKDSCSAKYSMLKLCITESGNFISPM